MVTGGNDFESRQKVLGYPVDVVNESEALSMIEQSWSQRRLMHVVTLNAEMVIQAQQNNRLDRIVRHAHLIVPDGAGPVWSLRMDGYEAVRVPGVDLVDKALSAAARMGVPVALLGSKPEVIEKLLSDLPKMHSGLNICASHHGYIKDEQEEEVVRELASKEPGLVLVAMGVPRQEYFIDKWMSLFPGAVIVGVGGSFDVFAGSVKRAPTLFQRLHLEWFYRLLKEPWRFSRMAKTLPNFAVQVVLRRIFENNQNAAVQQDIHQIARKSKPAGSGKKRNLEEKSPKRHKNSSEQQ